MATLTPAHDRTPRESLLGIARKVLPHLTPPFLVLAVATFLTPAVLLGSPDAFGTTGPLVQALLAGALAAVSAAAVLLALLVIIAAGGNRQTVLSLAAAALALIHAGRLALGIPPRGLAADLLVAIWFGAPLALWAAAVWPALRKRATWWAGPMVWVAVAFPLAFPLAALARIPLGTYTGGPLPTAVGWFLHYGPTLAIVGVAVMGWLSFELRHRRTPRDAVSRIAVPVIAAVSLGLAVAAVSQVGSILSATITWGSGYELFPTPPPIPPLGAAFVLVSLAAIAFAVTFIRHGDRRGRLVLLLLLAAVLCGVFPSPASVLGTLAALQLAWLRLTPAVAAATP